MSSKVLWDKSLKQEKYFNSNKKNQWRRLFGSFVGHQVKQKLTYIQLENVSNDNLNESNNMNLSWTEPNIPFLYSLFKMGDYKI